MLEEIENFEGILMATTNMTNNIDSAFERRFLFKIAFQQPTVMAKVQIWKSKMAHLSNEQCELLASQFDFTGGQIENIARKSKINEIIHGTNVDIQTLITFCDEERLSRQPSRTNIGFFKTNTTH